nr:putative replication associated protein [Crucivirus sp.]
MAAHIEKKKDKKLPSNDFVNGQYCVFTSWCLQAPVWNEEKMKYLVFQREQCPETERKHWQGYVEMKSSTRHLALKNLLGITDPIEDPVTMNKIPGGWKALQRRGNALQASSYCMKSESRVKPDVLPTEFGEAPSKTHKGSGHRTDLEAPSKMIIEGKSLKEVALLHPVAIVKYARGFEALHRLTDDVKPVDPEIKLRPWQESLVKVIDAGFVKRQILWVWSLKSATGKSTMRDYLLFKYGIDKVLPGSWTIADMLYAYQKHGLVIFDLPRKQELHNTHLAVLESMSDGGIKMSTKYESKPKLIRSVILVFANIPPPEAEMPERCVSIWIDTDEFKAEYTAAKKALTDDD